MCLIRFWNWKPNEGGQLTRSFQTYTNMNTGKDWLAHVGGRGNSVSVRLSSFPGCNGCWWLRSASFQRGVLKGNSRLSRAEPMTGKGYCKQSTRSNMSDWASVLRLVPLQLQGFQRRGSGEVQKMCSDFEYFLKWNVDKDIWSIASSPFFFFADRCLSFELFLLATGENSTCVKDMSWKRLTHHFG